MVTSQRSVFKKTRTVKNAAWKFEKILEVFSSFWPTLFIVFCGKMPPVHSKHCRQQDRTPRQGPPQKRKWQSVKINTRENHMFKNSYTQTAMVVGHSYVKRVKCYTKRCAEEVGVQEAIQASYTWQEKYNVNHSKLGDLFHYIGFMWAYVLSSVQMARVMQCLEVCKPNILILNIGSNDICDIMAFGGDVEELVENMVQKGRHLRDNCNVGCITYMTCLRRVKGFLGSQDQFEDLMKTFNEKLVEKVSPERCMRVHRVKAPTDGC